MRKSDLFELVAAIKSVAPEETPVIVGSQAVHLVTNFPPEIVRQSIECDFLLIGGKSETRAEINKKLGVFSKFQIEHGFYADALGLATVILPPNWQDRLQNFEDENGNVIANVAEIHDIAVSKLIAGREKDFLFLKELFIREIIGIDIFLERVRLVGSMPQSAVLISRLESLEKHLPKNEASKVRRLLNKLK
ncbi:MAG: DUF6036 family nucleotidyltransferase [Pyrinomonadaceae bacterium]